MELKCERIFTPLNMSSVMCHVSRVTCHLSHVTCAFLFCFFVCLFFGQSGETYWWRVCYQRGLPRLFFIVFSLALLSNDQFQASHWSSLPSSPFFFGSPNFFFDPRQKKNSPSLKKKKEKKEEEKSSKKSSW